MSDYQPYKFNEWYLERPIYKQAISLIRSYDSYKERMHDILMESPAPANGMPHGTKTVKEVETKVERREAYFRKTRIIEEALDVIPEFYRQGVWENIMHNKPYPAGAVPRTYRRYKARYIYEVAVRSGII